MFRALTAHPHSLNIFIFLVFVDYLGKLVDLAFMLSERQLAFSENLRARLLFEEG